MNLIALSTGLVLAPGRMWRAYARGSRSDNLYGAEMRASIDGGRWNDVASLRAKTLEVRGASPALPFRVIAFGVYGLVAMIIHTALAVPAVIMRFFTDTMLGASVFQAFKPTRRTDLY
jgi:hypothetical protein